MDDAFAVKVVKAVQHLFQDDGNACLVAGPGLHLQQAEGKTARCVCVCGVCVCVWCVCSVYVCVRV